MAIENTIGMIGVFSCIVIDIFLIIDLKMTLNLEKKLTTDTIDYEIACNEYYKTAEQTGKNIKQSETKNVK